MLLTTALAAGPRDAERKAAGPKFDDYPPKAGDVHPPLALWDLEHQAELSLAQHRGKKVLLIHFASW
jgi:hypothetical protein